MSWIAMLLMLLVLSTSLLLYTIIQYMMVPLTIARAWVCDPDTQGLAHALPCDRDIVSNMGH